MNATTSSSAAATPDRRKAQDSSSTDSSQSSSAKKTGKTGKERDRSPYSRLRLSGLGKEPFSFSSLFFGSKKKKKALSLSSQDAGSEIAVESAAGGNERGTVAVAAAAGGGGGSTKTKDSKLEYNTNIDDDVGDEKQASHVDINGNTSSPTSLPTSIGPMFSHDEVRHQYQQQKQRSSFLSPSKRTPTKGNTTLRQFSSTTAKAHFFSPPKWMEQTSRAEEKLIAAAGGGSAPQSPTIGVKTMEAMVDSPYQIREHDIRLEFKGRHSASEKEL
jgi:hypothetical protein